MTCKNVWARWNTTINRILPFLNESSYLIQKYCGSITKCNSFHFTLNCMLWICMILNFFVISQMFCCLLCRMNLFYILNWNQWLIDAIQFSYLINICLQLHCNHIYYLFAKNFKTLIRSFVYTFMIVINKVD